MPWLPGWVKSQYFNHIVIGIILFSFLDGFFFFCHKNINECTDHFYLAWILSILSYLEAPLFNTSWTTLAVFRMFHAFLCTLFSVNEHSFLSISGTKPNFLRWKTAIINFLGKNPRNTYKTAFFLGSLIALCSQRTVCYRQNHRM